MLQLKKTVVETVSNSNLKLCQTVNSSQSKGDCKGEFRFMVAEIFEMLLEVRNCKCDCKFYFRACIFTFQLIQNKKDK